MKLNTEFIARRQRELGLSRREIARALNTTITRMSNIYRSTYNGTVTLEQLGRLADVLACPPERLLMSDRNPEANATETDSLPTLAALLLSAGQPVGIATLAKILGTELATVDAALDDLSAQLERIGLTVRRSTNDGAVSIAAAALTSEAQLEAVLRGAQARQHLNTSAATLLHRIMTQRVTPRSVESNNDKRVQFGRLVNAGLVLEGAKQTHPARLTDDVRESLLMDVR
jgi:transcriptional regulator with XRE-family HTH domain